MELVACLVQFLRFTSEQKYKFKKMIVQRICDGQSVECLSSIIPFTSRTLYRWKARYVLGGFSALKDKKRSGRPRKWTPEHAEWIATVVLDKMPEQLKFEFAMWNVPRLRAAFLERFGVQLSLTTMRRIMKGLDLTCQRPKRRARKYSRQLVELWQQKVYPVIAKEANKKGATIVFADESGLQSQCVYGRTWGKKGTTPVVRVANSRFRLSILGAVSPSGELIYSVHKGAVNSTVFCQFLEKIQQEYGGTIVVIVDNLRVHKSAYVKAWLARSSGDIELEYQPTYSPEVNPVELLWALAKRRASQRVCRTKADLQRNIETVLEEIRESNDEVRSLFEEQDCRYITACIPEIAADPA